MKVINRSKVRGKKLYAECRTAKISRHEYGQDDPRLFCFGLVDSMNDELLPMCKACKAHVSNAEPWNGLNTWGGGTPRSDEYI